MWQKERQEMIRRQKKNVINNNDNIREIVDLKGRERARVNERKNGGTQNQPIHSIMSHL